MLAVLSYDWPGNVPELENAIRIAAATGRRTILSTQLPRPGMTMEQTEKEKIMEAARSTRGNITAAGDLLGFKSRQTMLNKMDRYGIPRNYGDPASV